MYGSDAVDGSPQRHRNMPNRNSDSLTTVAILAPNFSDELPIWQRSWSILL